MARIMSTKRATNSGEGRVTAASKEVFENVGIESRTERAETEVDPPHTCKRCTNTASCKGCVNVGVQRSESKGAHKLAVTITKRQKQTLIRLRPGSASDIDPPQTRSKCKNAARGN